MAVVGLKGQLIEDVGKKITTNEPALFAHSPQMTLEVSDQQIKNKTSWKQKEDKY